jgi:hypothetical protein
MTFRQRVKAVAAFIRWAMGTGRSGLTEAQERALLNEARRALGRKPIGGAT